MEMMFAGDVSVLLQKLSIGIVSTPRSVKLYGKDLKN
jgi:hypothetical protein